MVLAFRRHASPYAAFSCRLREIDPTATYEITQAHTYTPVPAQRLTGAQLQHFKAEIDERPGSVIIEYRKASNL